jgi:serine/threonine-protein kinase ATR
LSLGEASNKSIADLLKPYWRNIAVTVVKDLQSRPQKAQQLAELLRMSVNQMLLLTQFDTIPYLVLTKRKDVLQRIASARNPPTSVKDIITHPKRTFAAVLALLLRQQSTDLEEAVMDILRDSAPEFAEIDLQGLVNTDPPLIAFELLKATADADESMKNKVGEFL